MLIQPLQVWHQYDIFMYLLLHVPVSKAWYQFATTLFMIYATFLDLVVWNVNNTKIFE